LPLAWQLTKKQVEKEIWRSLNTNRQTSPRTHVTRAFSRICGEMKPHSRPKKRDGPHPLTQVLHAGEFAEVIEVDARHEAQKRFEQVDAEARSRSWEEYIGRLSGDSGEKETAEREADVRAAAAAADKAAQLYSAKQTWRREAMKKAAEVAMMAADECSAKETAKREAMQRSAKIADLASAAFRRAQDWEAPVTRAEGLHRFKDDQVINGIIGELESMMGEDVIKGDFFGTENNKKRQKEKSDDDDAGSQASESRPGEEKTEKEGGRNAKRRKSEESHT
ncbi:hypothetical protein QBC43DRAFT_361700, partial [Cladorrhinum sp. PSN259]